MGSGLVGLGARDHAGRSGSAGGSTPLLADALQTCIDVSDARGVAHCQEALAYVASEQAHYETAARLIGAAPALRVRVAARPPEAEQTRISALERILIRALGPGC